MRRAGVAIASLLLVLMVSVPVLRHASAPEFSRTSETTLQHAARSAPGIARSAVTIAVVGVEGPSPIPVAVVAVPAPRVVPAGPAITPRAPLRL